MSLLITGAAGFIGSHLAQRTLEQSNDQIVAVDDFNAFYAPAIKRANAALFAAHPRVTFVEQSFGNLAAMHDLIRRHQVRRVVHLGGYAGVRQSVADPRPYEEHNVRGTQALLEAARLAGDVERFVFVSSSTVYGDTAAVPFVEDAPLGTPLSPYGVTKRAAELAALEEYRSHSLPVVIVRPFSVYGTRIRPDLAMHVFARAILTGSPLPLLGDGSARRDFTHVNDICDGLAAALRAQAAVGEAINLGHHEPVAIIELLRMLERALGRTAIIERRPASPADMPLTCADLTKARRLLSYSPRVALSDGVAEFAAWFAATRPDLG
jgi:UDP-glucuronate 4-epimerase